MKDNLAQRKPGPGANRATWRKRLLTLGLRLLLGVGLLVAAILLLRVGWRSLERLFLSGNPHFTIRRIELSGECSPACRFEVEAQLRQAGVLVGESNLFAVDVAALRRQLTGRGVAVKGRTVMVADASVVRRLPGTLEVTVAERVPAARLSNGVLLDRDGWVLYPRPAGDPATGKLPAINSPEIRNFLPGVRAEGVGITPALYLLRLVAKHPGGRALEIWNIMLSPDRSFLVVVLHARGTFREGSRVYLPLDPDKMDAALDRVTDIVRDRTAGQQPTGFIDATYERNVPVRP